MLQEIIGRRPFGRDGADILQESSYGSQHHTKSTRMVRIQEITRTDRGCVRKHFVLLAQPFIEH